MILSEDYVGVTGSDTRRNIGELVHSLLPIRDYGMHLVDGSVLKRTGIYTSFIDYIRDIYNKYPNVFISEEEWNTSVNTYGVCGKFVYYPEKDEVRLPKVTGFIEGTIEESAVGQLVEAGLPNITGSFSVYGIENNPPVSGVFTKSETQNWYYGHITTDLAHHFATFSVDASRSSPAYGNSTTVQPQSIKGYLYIVVSPAVSLAPTDIKDEFNNVISEVKSARHVVESWSNEDGTSWYRKWNDGWIEQGGITVTGVTDELITFPCVFNTTNYNIVASPVAASVGRAVISCAFWNKSVNSTTILKRYSTAEGGSGASESFMWYACGY